MMGSEMAEETILEKAGVAVGVGLGVASNMADAVKSVFGSAVDIVAEALHKAPEVKVPAKLVAAPAKKAAKKTLAKKPLQKAVAKKTPPKTVVKKAVKKAATKSTAKKGATKKAAKKEPSEEAS
jgi:hypothetical protein